MSPDQHVTNALRDAYDHAVRTTDDLLGKAQKAQATATDLADQARDWGQRRDALREELGNRVRGAEELAALDQPPVPQLAATGPDLIQSGGRPMRTSPLGPR